MSNKQLQWTTVKGKAGSAKSTAAGGRQTATTQAITGELRQWIVEQAQAGHRPEVVLKSMTDSGWEEGVAIAALEETLEGFIAQQTAEQGLSVAKALPEPAVANGAVSLQADGHTVEVTMSMLNPRVVVFAGLLTDEECDQLRELASPRLVRSQTVDNNTGGSEINEARTSSGMFFARGETPLITRIEARLAALLNWPVENGEGLQVLHYTPGAEYKPHYDYFDPAQPGTPTILKRGGQRVGTLVMYLNTPEQGGGTSFPDVFLEVSARKGSAVFFSYDRPHPLTRSLHGGSPVVAGEKWVATKWLREGRFD